MRTLTDSQFEFVRQRHGVNIDVFLLFITMENGFLTSLCKSEVNIKWIKFLYVTQWVNPKTDPRRWTLIPLFTKYVDQNEWKNDEF